jgi:uncharacterized protein
MSIASQLITSWRRFRRGVVLAGVAVLALATAGPKIKAQDAWETMRDPTVIRGPNLHWFGQPRVQTVQPRQPKPAPRPRATAARPAPQAVVVTDQPSQPKTDPVHVIVVMGDTQAEQIAGGLDDAFGDRPDVAVLRRTRTDSGLVRNDFHDWSKSVQELLASDQKISVGVMLLGSNDRQVIREGEISHEPLSDRWRELYRERIDAVVAAFAQRRIPLVWVGAPPAQSTRLSADLIALNGMFRERSERAGGSYVDLWEAFVDAENRYAVSGPALSGQIARLRAADGVHFTRAGARKAAHFADVAIRRLIQSGAGPALIAVPAPEQRAPVDAAQPMPEAGPAPMSVDEIITRMAGLSPGQSGVVQPALPVLPVKPLVGPIMQMPSWQPARDAKLISDAASARGAGYQAQEIDRVFADGVLPTPRAGRADDFTWPRK